MASQSRERRGGLLVARLVPSLENGNVESHAELRIGHGTDG